MDVVAGEGDVSVVVLASFFQGNIYVDFILAEFVDRVFQDFGISKTLAVVEGDGLVFIRAVLLWIVF